ncbi:hypothetical protein GCM10010331_44770 [Streptomyces xanthochromogenes]|uniref:hypothetical protein n=1 Tax=Streptomyces xanthochromogenes TaxID=67384 RepID=UPI001677FA6B|nr:hypothetical protein [Streptomyces xanthochromogenes]GHB52232.1 hypothetical protein GCM10010331_44770 [Streptomyces xanthochromogenes]
MDGLTGASWLSAGVQWAADLVDEHRDMQEHGPEYVAQRRAWAGEQALRYSPYTPTRRPLATLSYIGVFGMLVIGFVAALAGGSERGSVAHIFMMVGIYACLLSVPLYIAVALRTGSVLAKAATKTLLDSPLDRSRTPGEFAARSMSQPLTHVWAALGTRVLALLPLPRLHTRIYQQSVYAALYRGLDVRDLPGAGR